MTKIKKIESKKELDYYSLKKKNKPSTKCEYCGYYSFVIYITEEHEKICDKCNDKKKEKM